nr:reverse transcriptase domain-containing protein [Tanacetum cinerariifolium]
LKAAFLAYFMQQKKYVKDLVEIHNIKQNDGETIEDFMKRFKVEIGRMKGAPKCMRISGFMHGVNNPELTKRLNEHVPKTMKEMMITTTAFIRGEAAAASKKKGNTTWKAQDQFKRKTSKKRFDFRGHPREGRGSNRFTPLTRTPKEILAAEAGKFQPPPPMVTPVEKRSSNNMISPQTLGGAFVSTPSLPLLRHSWITWGPVAAIPSAWPASGATPVVVTFSGEEPQGPLLPGLGLPVQSIVEKDFHWRSPETLGGAFVSTPSLPLLRHSWITWGPVAAIPSAWPASGATPVVVTFSGEEPQGPLLPGLGLPVQSIVEKDFHWRSPEVTFL